MSGTEAPARRRGPRGWAVDACLFLLAAVYGLAWSLDAADGAAAVNQVVAAAACAALWLRRRWPTGLALVLGPVAAVADLAAGALLVALFTVAVHRPPRVALTALLWALACRCAFVAVVTVRAAEVPTGLLLGYSTATALAVTGWGVYVRHRRQLLESLRERAVRAEAEAGLRAEQAQRRAREQIAQEMHDVLGHRLSLLSVHAGALEYRRDARPEEVAAAAGVIRKSAHQALQDLREVVGVLRAPVGEAPPPTLADLPALVAEARAEGVRVDLRSDPPTGVPDAVGRTAYGIVREALADARTRAPGAPVRVVIGAHPAGGLAIEVAHGAPAGPSPAAAPGTAEGTAGLAGRVARAGGTLEHGPAGGGFRLRCRLPLD
ncbi:sensor histidine kinase [Nocardiopsis trehalosi]|jgi:signal transduction histidine kinase|uniref:sensor histidine kinase n=1 Tax=Nocardiopsis trehalosi TaxID=109329 RepID=UPI0008318D6B|nr:histidine kinase [Nocardiopsis trehalosi]